MRLTGNYNAFRKTPKARTMGLSAFAAGSAIAGTAGFAGFDFLENGDTLSPSPVKVHQDSTDSLSALSAHLDHSP